MADVDINKFRASVVRDGSKPASPGFVVSEGQDPVNPPGTNNYVPYSGATANVELGEFGVEAGFITLDTTPTNTPTDQGTIFWDADDETVDIVLNGYTMKIGEDLFYPVKNQTGSTIAKGVAVRFNGTLGASGRLLIAPFIADGSVPSSRFMGVTAEEILNGEDGKVLYFGRVRGINTDAFNEGDILYASTTVAGGYQTAIPVAPNNIVQVAAVVTKHVNNGTIFVRPTLGSNLNTDEAVKLTSVADKNLLQYQSGTALWENKSLAQVLGGTSSQFVKGDGSLDSTSYQPLLTNPVTGTGASGQVAYFTGTNAISSESNLFWDATNDRLGIGTNTFGEKLSVYGVSGGDSFGFFSGGSGTTLAGIKMGNGGNTYGSLYFDNGSNDVILYQQFTSGNLRFGTNSTEKFRIFSDGNVLIQTGGTFTNNGARLQVSGTATFSSSVTINNASFYNRVFSDILPANDAQGVIYVREGNVSGADGLRYASRTHLFQSHTGSNYLAITLSGDVGINVTPTSGNRFWVKGSSTSSGDSTILAQNSANTNLFYVLNNGNVVMPNGNLLVGTTTDAGYKFQVNGGNGNQLLLNTTSQYCGISIANSSSVKGGVSWDNTNSIFGLFTNGSIPLSLETNNLPRLTITGGGNVGIGTTSVTTGKLVVKSGESNSTGIVLERQANTEKLVNIFSETADGKIAIASGTTRTIFLDSVGASYFTGGNLLVGTATNGASKLRIVGLPTSAAGLSSGDVWSDSGTLKIA